MRVMVFVPGDKNSEAGVMPSQDLISKMTKFNEALVKAGVMLDGQGLTPTSKAKRVKFEGSKRTVVDGHSRNRRSSSRATGSGRYARSRRRSSGSSAHPSMGVWR